MVLYKEFYTILIPLRHSYLLILLLFFSLLSAESVKITDIVKKSGSEIRWNPQRDKGLIISGERTISFMVDSSLLIVDNSRIITGVSIENNNGVIVTNDETAKLFLRLLNTPEDENMNQTSSEIFNIPVIIIDPGHGGRDSGALGAHGEFNLQEKDVVLDISHRVVSLLKNNYKQKNILLTRDDDTFLTLEERVKLANEIVLKKNEAVIYISVHANASINKNAEGFEVWFLPKDYRRNLLEADIYNDKVSSIVNAIKEDEINLEGEILASYILNGMNDQINYISTNRGLKEEIWFVVRKARMASVLIEVGFVTNKEEGYRLTTDTYLQKIAIGIYNGITDFVTKYESIGR